MSITLKHSQVDLVLANHQDFFAQKVEKIVRSFWDDFNSKNNTKDKSDNNKVAINIGDDYLKESILDLENKTGIDYKEVKAMGSLLGKNIFELTSPEYIPSDVAKILKLKSKTLITEIATIADMFDSLYLVKRIKRVANKNNYGKHETTVVFSILGILYLAYWIKNNGDLETFYVFNNPKIRDDIKSSLEEIEKGNYTTYKTKEDLKELFS